MKKAILIIGLLTVLAATGYSQDKGFGAGLIFGEPTGLSLKGWLSATTAWDAGLAWSFQSDSKNNDGSLHIHADYLWHDFSLISVSKGRMPLYFGVGGRARLGDKTKIGVRGVVGLSYMFDGAPIDIFLELAPVFDVVDETDFDLTGGIGVRYFF